MVVAGAACVVQQRLPGLVVEALGVVEMVDVVPAVLVARVVMVIGVVGLRRGIDAHLWAPVPVPAKDPVPRHENGGESAPLAVAGADAGAETDVDGEESAFVVGLVKNEAEVDAPAAFQEKGCREDLGQKEDTDGRSKS